MQYERHRIVHLEPAAWPALLASRPAWQAIATVADWVTRGHPLIARRLLCADAAGRVPLGLPLPPSLGKQRLAFDVPPAAIRSTTLPPRLADAARAAPRAWHATLAELLAIDPDTRCFGSLAWEHLTGMRYLSASSDIDLLWHPQTRAGADQWVAAVAAIEAKAPMRIDGEIVAPGGLAIQWREWAGEAHEVLAKSHEGNRLVARAEVFA